MYNIMMWELSIILYLSTLGLKEKTRRERGDNVELGVILKQI